MTVYTFPELHEACRDHGMKARLYIFDGGETVEVSNVEDGHQIVRVTSEHGDKASAVDQAALYLLNLGRLTVFDIVKR